jgi:hypothetical protein
MYPRHVDPSVFHHTDTHIYVFYLTLVYRFIINKTTERRANVTIIFYCILHV